MKKYKKVSTLKHPSGIVVDILMNQNNLEFLAEPLKGIVFLEKSAEVLRQKVWK